jgi:hypothetical protein
LTVLPHKEKGERENDKEGRRMHCAKEGATDRVENAAVDFWLLGERAAREQCKAQTKEDSCFCYCEDVRWRAFPMLLNTNTVAALIDKK